MKNTAGLGRHISFLEIELDLGQELHLDLFGVVYDELVVVESVTGLLSNPEN